MLTPTSFAGDRLVASGDGDFPGGPLSFSFVFGIKDDQVTDLAIDPFDSSPAGAARGLPEPAKVAVAGS